MTFSNEELLTEEWRPVSGFEGYYEVSNLGRVRSIDRRVSDGKLIRGKLKTIDNSQRYCNISLYKSNTGYNKSIHRLVAEAFISNPENKPEVNHKDGNTHNNKVNNLEWSTSRENIQHSICSGLRQTSWAKPVKCLDDGKIYSSMAEVARMLNTDTTRVSDSISSKRCCHGLTFVFVDTVDDEEEYLQNARAHYQGWHKRPNMPNSIGICFSDGQEFDSLSRASRALGCDPNTIRSHCESGKPYKGLTMWFTKFTNESL